MVLFTQTQTDPLNKLLLYKVNKTHQHQLHFKLSSYLQQKIIRCRWLYCWGAKPMAKQCSSCESWNDGEGNVLSRRHCPLSQHAPCHVQILPAKAWQLPELTALATTWRQPLYLPSIPSQKQISWQARHVARLSSSPAWQVVSLSGLIETTSRGVASLCSGLLKSRRNFQLTFSNTWRLNNEKASTAAK